MPDYASLKVPDLKKLLQLRGMHQSGNKADLIARLQEYDRVQAEDVIDWDGDETKVTSATAEKRDSKPTLDPDASPKAEPARKAAPLPAKALNVDEKKELDGAPPAVAGKDGQDASPAADEERAGLEPISAPRLDATDADHELKKREARAKRFGLITEVQSEEARKSERAKRFGIDATVIVSGLDDALPEGRPKRGRGPGQEDEGGGKRKSQDRRYGGRANGNSRSNRRDGDHHRLRENGGSGGTRKVLDDPMEKAKADARAMRFGLSN